MNFEDFISDSDANQRPRKIVIYGTHGIGKSSLAAAFPVGPVIFLPTEDGYQDLRPKVKVLTFGGKRTIESESELLEAISILERGEIDSREPFPAALSQGGRLSQGEPARMSRKTMG